MTDVPQTIAEAGAWLRNGTISAVELTQTQLDRAHATQETVAAFITICDEPALEAARVADAELAAGKDRGPLHGIPIAVKDIIATKEAPTTANSNVLDRNWGDGWDATVITKLRAAGAIMLGKVGLNEFACGWPDPDTGFRIPKNPWDLERFPGGSSSGTGAAIAGGIVLGGLGTDTGGSIRNPAAYCGISGIKQTFGLVSKYGCVPLGYSFDNIGPMARTVRDCALMLQVLAGYDPNDACSVNLPTPDMTAQLDGSLRGVRLGIPRDYFFSVPELDAEVKASVLAAIDQMVAAGAEVVEVHIPHAAEARSATFLAFLSEAFAYHLPDLQRQPERYGKYTRRVFQGAALFTAADYVQAQRLRSIVKAECAAVMQQVDVLITPTTPVTAPKFEGWNPDMMMMSPNFTSIWNLTGHPALSVNCGFSRAGLPIGMQIVGRPFDEPTVFKVGDAYQQITNWHTRVPELVKEVYV